MVKILTIPSITTSLVLNNWAQRVNIQEQLSDEFKLTTDQNSQQAGSCITKWELYMIMMIWCVRSLSILLKSYGDNGRVIMKDDGLVCNVLFNII